MEAPNKPKIDVLRSDVTSKAQGLMGSVKDMLEESQAKFKEARALGQTAEAMRMAIIGMGAEHLIEQMEQFEIQVRTLKNL